MHQRLASEAERHRPVLVSWRNVVIVLAFFTKFVETQNVTFLSYCLTVKTKGNEKILRSHGRSGVLLTHFLRDPS